MFGENLSHIDAIIDKFTQQTEVALSVAWQKMPFDYEKKARRLPAKPQNLPLMHSIAVLLARDFSYMRVDMYALKLRTIVGELTFTPTGGTDRYCPSKWDRKLGDLWTD